jgi:hypothetical protein
MSVVATPTSGSIVPATMPAQATAPAPGTVVVKPVRILPVLFRALADMIASALSRLLGRKRGGRS